MIITGGRFTSAAPPTSKITTYRWSTRSGEAIADGRPGRQWRLRLEDRVLLVAVY